MNKRRRPFTLIEVVVATTLLGLVGLPVFSGFRAGTAS